MMLNDVKDVIHELEQIVKAVKQRPGPTAPEVERRSADALTILKRIQDKLEYRQGQARGRRLNRKEARNLRYNAPLLTGRQSHD